MDDSFAPFGFQSQPNIPSSSVMMKEATDAAGGSSKVPDVCECGRDHRRAVTRSCPSFGILNQLHTHIADFVGAQELFEFGKDGPLAHGLRTTALIRYDMTVKVFELRQAASEQHPEWDLADEIARLRRYFDQVGEGCAEEVMVSRPPPSVMPDLGMRDDATLREAKGATVSCYDTCNQVVNMWFDDGARSLMTRDDYEGYLQDIDKAFRDAFKKITLLHQSQDKIIQDLTRMSYELWKEARRILYEFKPRSLRSAWPK